jgi:hypothetical protein
MKKFKLTIVVETDDNFDPADFVLPSHDVIDGFELTRLGDDITDEFKLHSAYIGDVEEI